MCEPITKHKLFEWIKNSAKGLNCLMFGCQEKPDVMCGCSYHYCHKHIEDVMIPRELDPHTIEFNKKWNWEDFRKFMYPPK